MPASRNSHPLHSTLTRATGLWSLGDADRARVRRETGRMPVSARRARLFEVVGSRPSDPPTESPRDASTPRSSRGKRRSHLLKHSAKDPAAGASLFETIEYLFDQLLTSAGWGAASPSHEYDGTHCTRWDREVLAPGRTTQLFIKEAPFLCFGVLLFIVVLLTAFIINTAVSMFGIYMRLLNPLVLVAFLLVKQLVRVALLLSAANLIFAVASSVDLLLLRGKAGFDPDASRFFYIGASNMYEPIPLRNARAMTAEQYMQTLHYGRVLACVPEFVMRKAFDGLVDLIEVPPLPETALGRAAWVVSYTLFVGHYVVQYYAELWLTAVKLIVGSPLIFRTALAGEAEAGLLVNAGAIVLANVLVCLCALKLFWPSGHGSLLAGVLLSAAGVLVLPVNGLRILRWTRRVLPRPGEE